jgi:hypothetical protein
MSHFYGSISGSARTDATRCGNKRSGILGHIRGWDFGIKVIGSHHEGEDVFDVYLTGGSRNVATRQFVATFRASDLTNAWVRRDMATIIAMETLSDFLESKS